MNPSSPDGETAQERPVPLGKGAVRRHEYRDYNAALGLVVLTVLLSGLTWTGEAGEAARELFTVTREGVLRGQVWRLFTYAFVANLNLWLIFNLLVLLYIARPLELVWGTRRFLTLVAVSVIGGGLTSVAFNQILLGGWALGLTLMLAHGFLFPESGIHLFFIIPVRVRTLANILTLIFVADCVRQGLTGLAYAAGMLSGILYYMHTTKSVPWLRRGRRRVARAVANPSSLVKGMSTARIVSRSRDIIEHHKAGEPLTEKDHAFVEELIQRSDPSKELCSPYSFSPDNDICPPCAEFGLCLRRFLETADEEAAETKS